MAHLPKYASIFLLVLFISSIHIEARVGVFLDYPPESEPEPQGPILAPSISPAFVPVPDDGGISFPPAFAPAPAENGIGFPPTFALAPAENGIGFPPAFAPTPGDGGISFAPEPIEGGIGFAPAPVESDNDHPYGLYGDNPAEFSLKETSSDTPTTTTTTTTTTTNGNDEDEFLENDIANEKLAVNYNAGNQYYNHNNRYSSTNYYNNGYENNYEQNGMSDTRFLENGKYYYDVNNENRRQRDRFNGYSDNGSFGYGEKPKYEFDTMEEYERQQGYPDTTKFYNP